MTTTYKNNLDSLQYIFSNISEYGQQHILKPLSSKLIHAHTDHSIHHWARPYPTHLNLLNLNYIDRIEELESAPFFLVRDGLFLTMDFFNRCLKNSELRSILLFHHGLKDFIPDEWRDNALFYEYSFTPQKSKIQFSNQKSKKIILKFHLMDKCYSFDKMVSIINKIDNYEEIILCFSIHETNFFLSEHWDGGAFLQSTYDSINLLKQECLKKVDKVSTITLKQLQAINDLSDFDFYNAGNFEHYYIDDFTNHHCLLFGATPILTKKAPANQDDIVFPLSFNKEIRVLANPATKDPSKLLAIKKGIDDLAIKPGQKFNTSAFQLVHSLTKEHVDFSWPTHFYHP